MACMLWEQTFYEDGMEIVERISNLVEKVAPSMVASLAIVARNEMKLRHVPLLVARIMAKLPEHKKFVASTLEAIIQRPDELSEFVSLYWKDGRQPLSAQVKKGLARAFQKFNAYQLGKYNRDSIIRLRDVLFLCHAKPKDHQQEILWKSLADNTLPIPDTWEVALSATKGEEKRQVWERLLSENKLGAMALLRNLRNMEQAGVSDFLVLKALNNMSVERILPFRFIAAARYAPQHEPELESAMFACLTNHDKLLGKTVILMDVSGSMEQQLSDRSEMTRMEAGCALAILAREICENVSVYSFSSQCMLVPARRGFALRDALEDSQKHGATYLGAAVKEINQSESYDRLIVFTDEQSHDTVPDPSGRGYLVNVASYQNGVGYGKWIHIDGFSEAVLDFIREIETNRICQERTTLLSEEEQNARL
jgi:hypothetical protein